MSRKCQYVGLTAWMPAFYLNLVCITQQRKRQLCCWWVCSHIYGNWKVGAWTQAAVWDSLPKASPSNDSLDLLLYVLQWAVWCPINAYLKTSVFPPQFIRANKLTHRWDTFTRVMNETHGVHWANGIMCKTKQLHMNIRMTTIVAGFPSFPKLVSVNWKMVTGFYQSPISWPKPVIYCTIFQNQWQPHTICDQLVADFLVYCVCHGLFGPAWTSWKPGTRIQETATS